MDNNQVLCGPKALGYRLKIAKTHCHSLVCTHSTNCAGRSSWITAKVGEVAGSSPAFEPERDGVAQWLERLSTAILVCAIKIRSAGRWVWVTVTQQARGEHRKGWPSLKGPEGLEPRLMPSPLLVRRQTIWDLGSRISELGSYGFAGRCIGLSGRRFESDRGFGSVAQW